VDRARLDWHTREAFEREFVTLLKSQNVILATDGCTIQLRIVATSPERYREALGLAWRQGDRIQPVLQLHIDALVRTLGNQRSPAVVGRALARVAAHELVHYLDQRVAHEASGVLRDRFSSAELASVDSRPFKLD
jgi:hypothetical protein